MRSESGIAVLVSMIQTWGLPSFIIDKCEIFVEKESKGFFI